jgi:hypothetical protein
VKEDEEGLLSQLLLAASITEGLAACGAVDCAAFDAAQAAYEDTMREIGARGFQVIDDGRGRPRLEGSWHND